LTRIILSGAALICLFFLTAFSGLCGMTEPVAQVFDVQGKATLKSAADGKSREVRKGSLLGRDDALTLEKNASIALYFKSGGRKDIPGKDTPSSYKVADLLPETQAYGQSVPLFGATRGRMSGEAADLFPPAVARSPGFFYPRETVILDSLPVIEFTLLRGEGEEIGLNGATVQILKNGAVVDSRKFDGLQYGSACVYQPQKLEVQTEYRVELKFELAQVAGSVVAVSFPLYIAGGDGTAAAAGYGPFGDPVYRSFESANVDHRGRKRAIALIKQLVRRGAASQPVIMIELFIS
jgi:hypothetical protein